ncbi:MAG: LuxR C-terminal-related transcriptional regulator [Pseudomonadota bacterium]
MCGCANDCTFGAWSPGALGIALGTVGNHIHNIYRKLQVRSNTEAVSKAQRGGLL